MEASNVAGVERAQIGKMGSSTYVDVGIEGIWEEGMVWKGKVPCRGIWDGNGRRVGGVWVLEGVVG